MNRRAQLRSVANSSSLAGALANAAGATRFATVRKPLSLDDFGGRAEAHEQAAAIQDFFERFGDLQTGQPLADLYHARAGSESLSGAGGGRGLFARRP